MADDAPEEKALKARRQVRNRMRERMDAILEAEHELSVPDLAGEMIDWIAHRPPLASQFLSESFRGQIATEIRALVGARRGSYVLLGADEIVDRQEFDIRKRVFKTRWARFTEQCVSAEGVLVQKPVMQMTRRQLLMAAAMRETAADRNLLYARLWRELARPLRGNQTVERRWTEDQIDALEQELTTSGRVTPAANTA